MTLSRYEAVTEGLRSTPRRWLVTGGAGFIGSHLVEQLLRLGQTVRVLDNFSTGSRRNIDDTSRSAGSAGALEIIEGDIGNLRDCEQACANVDHVLHQAALGSVPRSMEDPLSTHATNTDGFVHMLLASRSTKIKSFVYASSSSVYGDSRALPKVEERVGQPRSPYAATKAASELYGSAFAQSYGLRIIGLRYFNVFGPRQDPAGPYAAVIPRWIQALLSGRQAIIHGDGSATRDFCYVENVVRANLIAALSEPPAGASAIYNIACGAETSLTALFGLIRQQVTAFSPSAAEAEAKHAAPRPGDIDHSLASIEKARERLGYAPSHDLASGMKITTAWYARRLLGVTFCANSSS